MTAITQAAHVLVLVTSVVNSSGSTNIGSCFTASLLTTTTADITTTTTTTTTTAAATATPNTLSTVAVGAYNNGRHCRRRPSQLPPQLLHHRCQLGSDPGHAKHGTLGPYQLFHQRCNTRTRTLRSTQTGLQALNDRVRGSGRRSAA